MAAKKPNILFIMGDDIGWFNISAYNLGIMGYRTPDLLNLRSDPFERGPESLEYGKWMFERAFLIVPAQAIAGKWLESFKEFPPRQKPASFSLSEVMEKMSTAH